MMNQNGITPFLALCLAIVLPQGAALAGDEDASELAEEHITDYSELFPSVPDASFTSFGGPGQANIEIRGELWRVDIRHESARPAQGDPATQHRLDRIWRDGDPAYLRGGRLVFVLS
jgi:hypothetical protein